MEGIWVAKQLGNLLLNEKLYHYLSLRVVGLGTLVLFMSLTQWIRDQNSVSNYILLLGAELCLPDSYVETLTSGTCKCNLIWKKNLCVDLEAKLPCQEPWTNDCCLCKGRFVGMDHTHRKMGAEEGTLWLHAKERQGSVGNTRNQVSPGRILPRSRGWSTAD